jgi:hypothetical protein
LRIFSGQLRIGAVTAQHPYHGSADLPWAIALDLAFDEMNRLCRLTGIPEQIEV